MALLLLWPTMWNYKTLLASCFWHFGITFTILFSQAAYADVQFWADTITYDAVLEQISAEGSVRLESKGNVLSCKRLIYRAKKLTAYEAILVEPNGSIIQSAELACDDAFQEGFFQHVRATLKREDEDIPAHLDAEMIERSKGCTTDVSMASYTPCLLCDTKSPTWRIRSASVHHDQEAKRVSYKNAWLEVKGIPVLYTPYLAHSDPSVKRQSGWLFPGGGWSKRLGTWVRTPYFWDLGPHHDVMVTPLVMGSRPPGLGALYRRNVPRGSMILGGHLAPNRSSKKGDERQGWHLQGGLRYDLPNDMDRFSIDMQRASRVDDPTRAPLQSLYGSMWPNDLVSQATWLRVSDRYAIKSQVITFQSDNPTYQPVVHPYVSWHNHWPSNGWTWSGSFLSLSRRHTSANYRPELQRMSNEARYRKDWWIHHQNITFMASNRMDVYATPQHGVMQKMNPYASTSWRYPLQAISSGNGHIWGMQPAVLWAASPRAAKRWFPNEDSTTIEIDDTNFLMANRLQGQTDRFDATHRIVSGVDHSWQPRYASSQRVNIFWGIMKPLRYKDPHGERYGVTRILARSGPWQGRCRTLWRRSVALWNEYGVSVDATKTMIPVTYDVGLIRLGPQLMQLSQPLWQLSQQMQLNLQESWSIGAGRVQDLSTPKQYRRRAALQIYSLNYQDDCAKCTLSFYRTPVGINPMLQDTQSQQTQPPTNTSKVTKTPTSNTDVPSSTTSPYGQPVGSQKVDSGFLFAVTFKDLGTINPNPVGLPANPSILLAR